MARVVALLLFFGFVGLTLVAGWKVITTPYSVVIAVWAGGLIVGVLATPKLLHVLYGAVVLSTWRNDGTIFFDAADNRRWWLTRYTTTMTRPYGLIAIASVFAWRLALGTEVPLQWRWCLLIIGVWVLVAVAAAGGFPKDPDMPNLHGFPIKLWPALAVAAIFMATHFIAFTWLRTVLFAVVGIAVMFWTAMATTPSIQLFLRVDRGTSYSYPVN